MTEQKKPASHIQAPETIGHQTTKIPVELSTRFLEHFSEQLYSSPQKAFEELISNGWDAGACCVDVRISEDLYAPGATMCVFDDGISMDEKGLRDLWHIAFSPKTAAPVQFGRPVIGKFGIGKLATYVLANKLTYICKASDGVIRRVTMDYGTIDRQKGAKADHLINELELDLFEVEEKEVQAALKVIDGGQEILNLIQSSPPEPEDVGDEDEFGASKARFKPPKSGTWTIVVLSDLKPTGQQLRIGILCRMLRAALPFGSEMMIRVNGEVLRSSKIDQPILKEWVIGPDLGFDSIEVEVPKAPEPRTGEEAAPESDEPAPDTEVESVPIKAGKSPSPFIEIPGLLILA
ncbi:MAG TPA: ATP-binding protein [Verrucomicrobiae bacterium]|nr:ATP-binding protein [Verrucomicrobiae bacterium]